MSSNVTLPTGSIGTSALADGAVTPEKIATGAITLGYAERTSVFSTTSGSDVLITGMTATVTIPSGGRKIKVTVSFDSLYNDTTAKYTQATVWEGAVGSGTVLTQASYQSSSGDYGATITRSRIYNATAGSKTYNVSLKQLGGGTANMSASSSSPASLIIELAA